MRDPRAILNSREQANWRDSLKNVYYICSNLKKDLKIGTILPKDRLDLTWQDEHGTNIVCAGISSWGMKTWWRTPWMWQGSCTSSLASSLMTQSRDMSWSSPTGRSRGQGPSRSPDPSHSTTIIGGKRWTGRLWKILRILQSVENLWTRWTICNNDD